MFFWILINTLYLSWFAERKSLLRKFENSDLTETETETLDLDETFYHTHIPLFSMTISTATVIKATKYSTYYIIHNSYGVATKYSIISTEKSKVIVPGWCNVDKNNIYFHKTCLLPKYWKLLPLSHTFTDHAVKHKKLQIINITVCLKYRKQKVKRNRQWNNRWWQNDWNLGCWNTSGTSTVIHLPWQIYLFKYCY